MKVWICEKPSQAKDIAAVLGATGRGDGFIETRQGRVTWGIGHLLEQASPEHYDAALKDWSINLLPIAPTQWKLLPVKARAAQLKAIQGCLKGATEVVIATDADREGETIARELLEHFRYRGPVKRLWLRALDPESVKKAIATLKPGAETLPLHWAAQGRARADWLVGMNLTRAATKLAESSGERGVRSVGRVQTPTLALVVRRDREIENFVSRNFYELSARMVTAADQTVMLRFSPPSEPEDMRLYNREDAEQLATQARGAKGPLNVTMTRKRQGPPKLFSLSELQKACNRQFGWSADKTLSVAQDLYEGSQKLTTYPRTDCQFVPEEQMRSAPDILASLSEVNDLAAHAERASVAPVFRKSTFDTSKITAHHAIVPTGLRPNLSALSEDSRKAFLLVAQRYVAALLPDHEYDETRIRFDAKGVPFSAVGRVPRVPGWKAVFRPGDPDASNDDDNAPPLPLIPNGEQALAQQVEVEGKKTEPPKPYTEGTLIDDMKSVAKYATDPAIRSRLKETSGIGTEATRASIIKTLRDRAFIEAKGKSVRSTVVGRALIDALPPDICDPALTAVWEDRLDELASGRAQEGARELFTKYIEEFVRKLLEDIKARMPATGAAQGSATSAGVRPPSAKALALAQDLAEKAGLRELPPNVQASAADCSAFIEQYMPSDRQATDVPTASQLQQLDRIERDRGEVAPQEARQSKKACSAYLDGVFGTRPHAGGRRFSR
ncbi:MAG: DNA topoisomerase 3 [Dokdonella sp.]